MNPWEDGYWQLWESKVPQYKKGLNENTLPVDAKHISALCYSMSELDKKIVLFDWCAIQTLHNRVIKEEFDIEKLKNRFSLFFTGVNLNEAAVIKNREKRFELLRFCADLFRQNKTVIDLPEIILKKSFYAYRDKKSEINPIIERDVFDFLCNPQNYPEDYIDNQKESYRIMNEVFIIMNTKIREDPRTKKIIRNKKFIGNLSIFLDTMSKRKDIQDEFFLAAKKSLKIEDSDESYGSVLIKELFPWSLYWNALFLGTYIQAFRRPDSRQLQIIDLQQIIYLGGCDYFITCDKPFYEALRLFEANIIFRVNAKSFLLDEFISLYALKD